ncbi:MAG: PQQ-dependent sugar dehydrogenase, partial [Armatimonadota bacterium]|nr:PQQ-dependent sugar dehydrogenase [Armatimonadota bacterium]
MNLVKMVWPRLSAALIVVALGLITGNISSSARAATLPAGFTETLYASGLNSPTTMAFAPDGRLFVCEQQGALRVIKNGTLLPTPFVTIPVPAQNEQGLIGVAIDPDFATNGYVYVYHTTSSPNLHNQVARYTAEGDVARAGSAFVLLDLDPLFAAFHNGGAMRFGSDGKLYIAVGDNTRSHLAQTLDNRLGKILRINKDGTIPTDNPFYFQTSGVNRAIYALGLRNPFTLAIQPGTGRIFANDVGEDTWEEVSDIKAGGNYGWPLVEGPTNNPPAVQFGSYQNPTFAYMHGGTLTTGCAVIGGAFYNPARPTFPSDYIGDYFFADLCIGWIRRLDLATGTASGFATGLDHPVSLTLGPDGALYYLVQGNVNSVYKIQYTANQAPVITRHPASQTITAGQPVTFSVSATGSAPLSYQWQRNGINISGATAASYTISSVTTADNGAQFRVIVSNSLGQAISNSATLTVGPPLGAGNGTGLTGTYYDNQDFTGTTLTRVDPQVLFDWGEASPAPSLGADTFSVRWTGQVQAQVSETYTFYSRSDDGVRLWVNNQLLIDNWTDHAVEENSGTIQLTAGVRYAIKMEFYEGGGEAVAQLLWSSPSTPKQAVPKTQLYPTATSSQPPVITQHPISQTKAAGQSVTFSVTATGTAPLSYQWQRDGVNIPNAIYRNYQIYPVALRDNGAKFRVIVSNSVGRVISNSATLTVTQPPVITTHPASQTIPVGQSVTFSVTATGTAPLSYQWQRDGVNIPNAIYRNYQIYPVALRDNGARFRVIVRNNYGQVVSNSATLTVTNDRPPTATIT